MDPILKHPWIINGWHFVQSHPVLWFSLFLVLLFIILINWLGSILPQIEILRSKIFLPLARFFRHKKLVKSAIRSDIRGHVNKEILKLKDYLPQGWAEDMDIQWVINEESSAIKNDGRLIIRIRPVESQDNNFVNTVYYYFKNSFFPKTQSVIPKAHYEASVLFVCRNIAESRNELTKTIFEDEILEPVIQRHKKVPNLLEEYKDLDSRGFFFGTFLRELQFVAKNSRFNSARDTIHEEAKGIIKHIKNFILTLQTEEGVPSSGWHNKGSVSLYAILLVAHPLKTAGGIDPYINRAKSHFETGIKCLYVFGASEEAKFATSVIEGIEKSIPTIRLNEKFLTSFDYRGRQGGIGAVFTKNE